MAFIVENFSVSVLVSIVSGLVLEIFRSRSQSWSRKNYQVSFSTFVISTISLAGHAMEWKENFGVEYGIVKAWNGMEDFINGMERIFDTFISFPYLLILMLFYTKCNQ